MSKIIISTFFAQFWWSRGQNGTIFDREFNGITCKSQRRQEVLQNFQKGFPFDLNSWRWFLGKVFDLVIYKMT